MNHQEYTYITPCHFGLESVLKREITDLGYTIEQVEDGKITWKGDAAAGARANVFLRTTERVLLCVGKFRAETFDQLFEETKKIPWEEYLPKDARFWVAKANSIKSKLFSPSDIQSIIKKAIVERMKETYHVSWFPEDGASYPLRVSLMKDEVTIGLDTTGVSLHKRGYRQATAKAPISETLASALIMLTPWKGDRILVDPFCGSGTFPIEAAMMAAHIAPGARRSFRGEEWTALMPQEVWNEAREEALSLEDRQIRTDIQGYDIDGSVIRSARENAERAGVAQMIHLQQRPLSELSHSGSYGFLFANPPYGERLEEKEELPALYTELGERFARLDTWSMYVITAYEDAERYIGKKAAKNRKIYNGMIKTYFYQYPGPRPPKRERNIPQEER